MTTFEFDIAKIKCCHFILITLFKLEPPPRRAHVKFHHLISGEMLDGCELPPPSLHFNQQHILTMHYVEVEKWNNAERWTVVSVTVMGSWEPGLSRRPPQANGPICQVEEEIG